MFRLTTVALAFVALLAIAIPGNADSHCRRVVIVEAGKVTAIWVCDPLDDGGDEGRGGGGGDESDCETVLADGPEPIIEGPNGEVYQLHVRICDGRPDDYFYVCVANCGGDEPTPPEIFDGLLMKATAQADPPLPGMRSSFDQPAHDGDVRAVVNAESWWWAESTTTIEAYDEDGPVWVRVTASAERMEIDPGDGSDLIVALPPDNPDFDEQADCPLPGVAYNRNQSYYDQVPGEERGACVHVYEERADEVTATMTVTWTLTYEGFLPGAGPGNPNVSGTVGPQEREQTLSFPVKEIQSVIVR